MSKASLVNAANATSGIFYLSAGKILIISDANPNFLEILSIGTLII